MLIKNRTSFNEYRVSVILRVETVLYTGRVGDPVKRLHIDRLVRPGVLEEVRMEVSWEEYGPRLLNQCAFNIACLATVKDTNFEYFAQDDFRVRKPDIKITVRTSSRRVNPVGGSLSELKRDFFCSVSWRTTRWSARS